MLREMLNLLLPDPITKRVERLHRARARTAQAELFKLGINILQFLDNAEEIIDHLEGQAKKYESGQDFEIYAETTELICEQGYLLNRINILLERFSNEVAAIDPNLKKEMGLFSAGKAPLFFEVSNSMMQGVFPLPWEEDPDFEYGIDLNVIAPKEKKYFTVGTKVKGQLKDFYTIHYSLTDETVVLIKKYLSEYKPKERVAELRRMTESFLSEMRSLSDFSDILPYLSDQGRRA